MRVEDGSIEWTNYAIDDCATYIQAGFRGLKAREEITVEVTHLQKVVETKNKELEQKLGIDLTDPGVIKATTTIQAGYRGYHARQLLKKTLPLPTPAIFISKPEESLEDEDGSEDFTYVYEDEDDEESEYEARSGSPQTAIEDFPITIGGFTTTFGIR